MLPDEGYYIGVLKEAVLTESKDKGTPALSLKYDVVQKKDSDGGHTPLASPFERTVDLWLSDGAWPYTMEKLQKLAFNGDFDNPSFGESEFSQGVPLQCRHEEYENKPREKWDLALGGGRQLEAARPDVRRKFNLKWRQAVGTTPPPATSSPPTPPRSAPLAAPPPAASSNGTATAVAEQVTTREQAWALFLEVFKEDAEKATQAWNAGITKVAADHAKTEDQFVALDWQAVSDEAIPF